MFTTFKRFQRSCSMCASNVSHLPAKITAKDREKQYICILHESGGELFCTACDIVVEHKHKSSIDKRFATAKHNYRTAELQAGRQTTRQIVGENCSNNLIFNIRKIATYATFIAKFTSSCTVIATKT